MACVITLDGKKYDEAGFKQLLASGFLVDEINSGVLKDSKSEIYKQYINGNGTTEVSGGEAQQTAAQAQEAQGTGAEASQATAGTETGNKIPDFDKLTTEQQDDFAAALDEINQETGKNISTREAFNKLKVYLGLENMPFITNMKAAISISLDQSRVSNNLKELKKAGKTKIKGKFARSRVGQTLLSLKAAMNSLGFDVAVLSDEDFNKFFEETYGISSKNQNAFYAWGAKTMVIKESNSQQVALHEFIHPLLQIIEEVSYETYAGLVKVAMDLGGDTSSGPIDGVNAHPSGTTFAEWAQKFYGGANIETINNETLTELISILANKRVDLSSRLGQMAMRVWSDILAFFGIKRAHINIKIDDTLTISALAKAVSEAAITARSIKVMNASGVEIVTKQGISSSKNGNLVEDAGLNRYMTEDGNGNYVFYHVSNIDLTKKGIDPNKLGSNMRTGRDETMAKYPVSMYYTEPDISEVYGDYKHVVTIPKEKVYPADQDPLNLRPLAEKEFRKTFPNIAFDNNRAVSWIGKVAADKGYEMVVASWSPRRNFKALRAESVIKQKPKLYEKPSGGLGYGVTVDEKYEFESNRRKKGFSSSIDPRLSEQGVAVSSKEKLPKKINPEKEAETLKQIDTLLDTYSNALKDPSQWKELMSRVFSYKDEEGNVIIPKIPVALSKMALSEAEVLKEISKVSDKQRQLASDGLKGTKEIGDLYKEGKMDEVDTGLYFLWNIMSIGISPYPQEAGFLRAVEYGIDKYIKKAAEGNFLTGEMVEVEDIDEETGAVKKKLVDKALADYYDWVDSVLIKNTPGAGAKSNLRAFGKNFLSKASEKIKSGEFAGKTRLQALHEILSDRTTPTNQLRRKWQANMSGMSFNNKIFDFILLTTGRSDLFVIDRVRTEHFWDAENLKQTSGLAPSTSIYDGKELLFGKTKGAGYSKMLSDISGLVFAELANRTMQPIVQSAYKKLGVTESPDVGRFHWETWVAASSQEVSHGSIDAIVQRKKFGEITDAGIRQGKYGSWDFNFSYRKRAGKDFQYEFTDDNGNVYLFDDIAPIYEEISEQNNNKKYKTNEERFILKDEDGSVIKRKTEKINEAWYDQPGVNKQKYFEFLASKAKEVIPAPNVAEDKTGVKKPSTKKGISSSRSTNTVGKSVEVKDAPMGNYLNIGLIEGRTGKMMDPNELLSKIPERVKVVSSAEVDGMEKTLSVKLDKPLTDAEMVKLLDDTKQQGIPQLVDGVGVLYDNKRGTDEGWGEFDPQYFIMEDNKPLAAPSQEAGVTDLTPKFAESAKLFDEIQEADGAAKKRRLAEERRALIESSPEVKFIDDNIKNIYEQLENKGVLSREGNCP